MLRFTLLSVGEYVASGSDDGRWFIWEKRTGRLMKMLEGDRAGRTAFLILAHYSIGGMLSFVY